MSDNMENKLAVSMESIMGASFGEVSNTIRATYKKTVNVKQYETEVVELESVLDIGDRVLTGAERMLMSAMLQAQLEYTAYCNLTLKGLVTQTELNVRKKQLVDSVAIIKTKAEAVSGKSMDNLFDNKS